MNLELVKTLLEQDFRHDKGKGKEREGKAKAGEEAAAVRVLQMMTGKGTDWRNKHCKQRSQSHWHRRDWDQVGCRSVNSHHCA